MMEALKLLLGLAACSACFGALAMGADAIRRRDFDGEDLLMVFCMGVLILAIMGGLL